MDDGEAGGTIKVFTAAKNGWRWTGEAMFGRGMPLFQFETEDGDKVWVISSFEPTKPFPGPANLSAHGGG
jgi:hypothetical protein